ncbi:MAG: DUF4118 domain-containing protein [Fimbriimonadaceae bacterium]|nr:DUF4118 domain-containing protein [Fimbriimonadaceae bacterium]
MSNSNQTSPYLDRPLDKSAAARVSAPGIAVIITRESNIESLVREALNVAEIRGRLLYAILVEDDLGPLVDQEARWKNEVYRIAHKVKSDHIKLNRANLVENIYDYCVQFDIRLLVLERPNKRTFSLPWETNFVQKIINSEVLPPSVVIPFEERQVKPGQKHVASDWLLLIGVILAISIFGAITRDQIPKAFHLLTFILALTIVSSRISLITSVAGSFIAPIAFKLAHVAPYGTFLFEDPRQWLNLIGLLTVSLIINTLTWQVKTGLKETQIQERRKSALFNLTRDLLQKNSLEEIASLAEAHIRDVIDSDIALFVQYEGQEVTTIRHGNVDMDSSPEDRKARDICLSQGIEAGIGTQVYPLAYGLYLSLQSKNNFKGCLAVYPGSHRGTFPPDQLRILDTFGSLIGLAFERIGFETAQREADQKIRDTNLQNTLLRSVSHDLKTPLTSITGYANQLAEDPNLPAELRVETYTTIRDQAWRLTNLVNNLLSITKLESAHLDLDTEVMFVEELIGTAVSQMRPQLEHHKLILDIAEDIPDVAVDALIFNQALVNLIGNAIKYTPAGCTITVKAQRDKQWVQISVIDDGPGLPEEGIDSIFEKFTRFQQGHKVEGTGLGLAIVKAVAELHGGNVMACNRSDGHSGAEFDIRLPAVESAPIDVETS